MVATLLLLSLKVCLWGKKTPYLSSCYGLHGVCRSLVVLLLDTKIIPSENSALPGEDKEPPGESQPAEEAHTPQNGLTHLKKSAQGQKSGSQINNFRMKIATLNISSFTEKATQLIKTMIKRNLYVLGLSQTRLTKTEASPLPEGYKLYHKGGVAFILSPEADRRKRRVFYRGENIICVDLSLGNTELSIIQVYAPDAEKPVSERKVFYKALQDVYNLKKYQDNVILMGDFNGHVGTEQKGKGCIIGPFSVGDRNPPGKFIIEFCASNSLSVMNTFFMHAEKFVDMVQTHKTT